MVNKVLKLAGILLLPVFFLGSCNINTIRNPVFESSVYSETEKSSSLNKAGTFGSNPGNLNMYTYIPAALPENAPLVVALHGCTMTAQDYDDETGWVKLANEGKFALLFPEQKKENNNYGCFNWGGDPNTNQSDMDSCDTRRGCGENLSIKQMIDYVKENYKINSQRVFITGLSAGGAFASVMLAVYPDIFSGGAIIAGIPYMCNLKSNGKLDATEASMCTNMGKNKTPDEWSNLIKNKNGYDEPQNVKWPTVQVWQGDKDNIVKPANQNEIMKQWTALHGTDQKPEIEDKVNGYPHKIYSDSSGNPVVETYTINNMGHGVPVDIDGTGGYQCGSKGAYMENTSICSTYHIAKSWKLLN
jgi:poly(hydroxyalkanoate) depolymerase family esterase